MAAAGNTNPFQQQDNRSTAVYSDGDYESFCRYDRVRFVMDIAAKRIRGGMSVLDIGCANGGFIYCLKKRIPTAHCCGIDLSPALIDAARREPALADAEFHVGDAEAFSLGRKFDVVFMQGVHSIFDDYAKVVQNAVSHLAAAGTLYVFGMFNRFDIDVILRYRDHVGGAGTWESGLNNFSLARFRGFLDCLGLAVETYPFQHQLQLPERPDAPIRSYTLTTQERGTLLANGTGIITDFYLLEVTRAAR